ncbi:MAG: GIY-YIG nuclease family protein, partial [Actinomyces sp.]
RILVTDGDPDGVRVIDKSNWTGKGIVFPRSLLGAAKAQGLQAPGVYILIGQDDSKAGEATIYVGQAEDVAKRLTQHLRDDDKDFWSETVAFVSSGEPLNRAHISYLESKLVALAHAAKRATVVNANQPGEPAMSAADRAEADGFLAELLNILPAIGVDHFTTAPPRATETREYVLAERGASGRGHELPEGFLVLAGARARKDHTPSAPDNVTALRAALVADGSLRDEGDHLVLTTDTLFRSPSLAAAVLVGGSINGREAWKDEEGVTLKQRQLEGAER